MAATCLECLLVDKASPMLPYAARYWSLHAGDCSPGTDSEDDILARAFLQDRGKLSRAFKAIPEARDYDTDTMTGLHATVFLNISQWASALIKTPSVDINAKCSDGQTALHWAVRLGRRRLVSHLQEHSANPNIREKTGDTPLHLALIRPPTDSTRIVKARVNRGVRIDMLGARGVMALSELFSYGPHINHSSDASADQLATLNEAVGDNVKYLVDVVLDRGVDLNRPTSDGWLPLIHAANTGSVRMLRCLLEREPCPADVGLRDLNDVKSPLRGAVFYKKSAAVRLLIEHGADVNESNDDGWTPLIQAVKYQDEELVWLLLIDGARPDTVDNNGWPALLHAVKSRQRAIVWLLLVTGKADAHLHSSKVLKLSMGNKDLATAWLLCQHGVDVDVADEEGRMPLHRASQRGSARDVEFLLTQGAQGARPDSTGFMPLHHAVLRWEPETDKLLARRASRLGHLDRQDAHGHTALSLATLQQSEPMMQTLLRHKASCDRLNRRGMTALHYAARHGFNQGLRLLLRNAADSDRVDEKGYSAMHHAVSSDKANMQTVHLLATSGANLEGQNKEDLTPPMLAAYLWKASFVRQLLAHHADDNMRNSRGQTAYELAEDSVVRDEFYTRRHKY
ncbi:ankyrin repeats (3 copies) domain-containing protein [Hirsutella rhossiliensis]|uniref:Ankyrin repeats (3 copies) domain-containing protein n=1 Tax=Hirsutella rhossiliensis TaxID=111463 RepID=A0A9P8MWB9_9HYPO|nr:ankyrin repeats (3 copies) domain-containing protein [Hirsutella rhossiliensis]KAH0962227.1 ankyrin repeats (3 copies) domain-containing protein [Hirsutella rhossiliensis]